MTVQLYDFESQRSEWSNPPVDDIGYLSSAELLERGDEDLKRLIEQTQQTRYSGWRNYKNRWRQCLGLDSTSGKSILDFGCGIGLEALQFAPRNRVIVADIVPDNVRLASRVARLFGFSVETADISESWPFIEVEAVDIFYCNGVLHHIPYAEWVLRRAAKISSEIRLMLYSDRGWSKYVGSALPPIDTDIRAHPDFDRFVRTFDGVGSYADWYSREKLEYRFGSFLTLRAFDYITDDGRYCVAILEPK